MNSPSISCIRSPARGLGTIQQQKFTNVGSSECRPPAARAKKRFPRSLRSRRPPTAMPDAVAGRVKVGAYATTPRNFSSSVLLIPNLYVPDRLHDAPKLRFLAGRKNRLFGEFFCFHRTYIVRCCGLSQLKYSSAMQTSNSDSHRAPVRESHTTPRVLLREENCRQTFDLFPNVPQRVDDCL
jgi:hypothetical protein